MIDSDDERLHSAEFVERVCRSLLEAVSYLHSRGVVHNDIKPENVMIARIGNQVKLVDLGCAVTDMWDATEGYTPDYKAPEQGDGETNVYTDIFLIGKLMEILVPIAGVEQRWRQFIAKATAENSGDRFATGDEALKSIPRKDNHRWIWLAAAITVVMTFTVAYLAFRPQKEVAENPIVYVGIDSVGNHNTRKSPEQPNPEVGNVSSDPTPSASRIHDIEEIVNIEPDAPERTVLETSVPTGGVKTETRIPALDAVIEAGASAPTALSQVSGQYSRKQLTAMMEQYIKSKFEHELLPEYRKYAAMPLSYDKCRYDVKLNAKMKQVTNDLFAYVEGLAQKYPKEESFIIKTGYDMMEIQQINSLRVKYPRGEEVEAEEKIKTLDKDSIYDIYIK